MEMTARRQAFLTHLFGRTMRRETARCQGLSNSQQQISRGATGTHPALLTLLTALTSRPYTGGETSSRFPLVKPAKILSRNKPGSSLPLRKDSPRASRPKGSHVDAIVATPKAPPHIKDERPRDLLGETVARMVSR